MQTTIVRLLRIEPQAMHCLACMAACMMLLAQPPHLRSQSDTIPLSPLARRLHILWSVPFLYNSQTAENLRTFNVLGDIYGTGHSAVITINDPDSTWHVFRFTGGGIAPDTVPEQILPAPPSDVFDETGFLMRPVSGDFWGTGHPAVVFPWVIPGTDDGDHLTLYGLDIYRTEQRRIPSIAAAVCALNPRRDYQGPYGEPYPIAAADLDGDGADEIIVSWPGSGFDIYKGGSDFRVPAATLSVRYPQDSSIQYYRYSQLLIGDFDGDHHSDLVTLRDGGVIIFYWGDGTIRGFGDSTHRETVALPPDNQRITNLTATDCDGDGIEDIIMSCQRPAGTLQENQLRIFRSGAGRSARTRSYDFSDVDFVIPGEQRYSVQCADAGPLNDASGRFPMLAVDPGSYAPDTTYFLSSRPDGPSRSYMAFTDSVRSGIFGILPAGDIDGDGWADCIGVAGTPARLQVLAGGPYIPSPERSDVLRTSVADRANALAVWPVPAHDVVNIAWRGDLAAMPRGFRVYNMRGEETACGEVPEGSGSTAWRCRQALPGTYLLVVSDAHGTPVANACIVKQ
ncbi:MAG TPA: VCBS repeat-containing protein [Candidatus Kapabacteria bacterium]|nr:VCBS repeat-containing protein [Candidatus Kapabacteria bacterium]